MRKQIEKRLQELRNEYEAGQKILSELGARQANMQETMLRISGAIQALEELSHTEQTTSDENGESEAKSTASLHADLDRIPSR